MSGQQPEAICQSRQAPAQTSITPMAPSRSTLSQALAASRIPGLDFLRLTAVFLVIGYHAGLNPDNGPEWLNGNVGVEIFFVLSGFLITRILLDEHARHGRLDLMAFYQRRFARLMPVFYVYVLLCVVVVHLRHKELPWGVVWSSLLYVVNYYQGLNDAPTHVLSHCWSLAVEEQFYVLWPLVLAWSLKPGRRLQAIQLTWCIIVAMWVYRAWLFNAGLASDAYVYRALETRADQLLVGCALAMTVREPTLLSKLEALCLKVWPVLLAAAILVLSGTQGQHLVYRYSLGYVIEPLMVFILIPACILAAHRAPGAGLQGWLSRLLNQRTVVQLGQASYGIYLFHQLIFHPMRTALAQWTGFYLSFVLAFLMLGLVAHLSYTRFEQPIRERLRPGAAPRASAAV
jgi:peptidoglycan/LPS O-acetylase OafA/YrhL